MRIYSNIDQANFHAFYEFFQNRKHAVALDLFHRFYRDLDHEQKHVVMASVEAEMFKGI
jgi:hypothetical protein